MKIHAEARRWLPLTRGIADQRVCLFCFPHLGGSAASYLGWQRALSENNFMEVLPVELPGHGTRSSEPAVIDARPLFHEMASALIPVIEGRPCMLFGHSFGGLIAFHFASLLIDKHCITPKHLFLSAVAPPHLRSRFPAQSSDRDVAAWLQDIGHTEKVIFESPILREHFLSVLKSDLVLGDEILQLTARKLPIPITVFGGTEDGITSLSALAEWDEYTSSLFECFSFPGDHFYLRKHERMLLSIIARKSMSCEVSQ